MKKDTEFWQSALRNNLSWRQYYNRLVELSVSMFEWKNLPETIDPRFLELALFSEGHAVFFEDEVLGYLALRCTIGGTFDVYRIPRNRRAIASNGYNKDLDESNSVLIFNNYLHTNSMLDVQIFSKRLYNLDRTIDVNVNAQKTPILITCDEKERLSMLNMYKEYDGNAPLIKGDKSLNPKGMTVLTTGAPYVADRLYTLKTQIWNEALTYLGIPNVSAVKKERLISDEVQRSQGGTVASRYSRLEMRKEACRKINKMFNLNIDVDYRSDFELIDMDGLQEGGAKDE